jgi:hypothetical protein
LRLLIQTQYLNQETRYEEIQLHWEWYRFLYQMNFHSNASSRIDIRTLKQRRRLDM